MTRRSDPRLCVANANLPMRPPLLLSIVMWLLLDRLAAPGWVWGAVGLFLALVWFVWVWDAATRRAVDILHTQNRRAEEQCKN
jgi:hypothetical protein